MMELVFHLMEAETREERCKCWGARLVVRADRSGRRAAAGGVGCRALKRALQSVVAFARALPTVI